MIGPTEGVVVNSLVRCGLKSAMRGLVKNKAVCVALADNSDGEKDVLGLSIEHREGAKFWLRVVNELKTRGVNDMLIAVVDGLKGFPEAINSVYPHAFLCRLGNVVAQPSIDD